MLVNHPDPAVDGFVWAGEVNFLALDADRAFVGVVQPVDNVHQSAFSRAVFAQQRQDFAPVERQIDIVIGEDARKTLGNAFDLENDVVGAHALSTS